MNGGLSFAGCLWFLLLAANGSSQGLRIEGEVQYWQASGPTSNDLRVACKFVAASDTNHNWSISVQPVVGRPMLNRLQIKPLTVVGCKDYISVLEQFSLEEIPGLKEHVAREAKAELEQALDLDRQQFWRAIRAGSNVITNRVVIFPTTIPSMDGRSFAAGIWIPYLSGPQVGWTSVKEFPRVFSMRPMQTDHGSCRVLVDMDARSAAFPKSISFLRVEAGKRPNQGRSKTVLPETSPVFVGHTIEAQFRVIESTNFQGITYPRVSQMDYFKSSRDPATSDSGAYVWVRVEAHSFSKTNGLIVLPTEAVSGKTHVLDDRLTVEGGRRIDYVTDTKVPDLKSKEDRQRLMRAQDARKAILDSIKAKSAK